MYTAFYGMEFNPFSKSIDTKKAFESDDFNQATARLNYLKEVKGFGLFTGLPGTGKSFTLRKFTECLNPNLYKVVYIPLSTLTVNDFYRALSYELGLEPAHKKIIMFNQIQERIRTLHESKNIVPIIILDEAQYLKNSILDDLKIIFNFNLDSKNYAALILSGQPILNSILQRQAHEALKQRIVINYTFGGLSKKEVSDYITSRMKLCGVSSPIFSEEAIELIATTCGGCTRKINLLVEKSLILGYQKKLLSIDSETIYTAQNDIELTI